MLLLGFGAALRRSELMALDDAAIVPGRGVRGRIGRSKTDQQGRGQEVAIWANRPSRNFIRWWRWRLGCASGSGGPMWPARMRWAAAVRRRDQLSMAVKIRAITAAGEKLARNLP